MTEKRLARIYHEARPGHRFLFFSRLVMGFVSLCFFFLSEDVPCSMYLSGLGKSLGLQAGGVE